MAAPTIKSYWERGQCAGNGGIGNVISRTRFEQLMRNLHFEDNQEDKKSDKAYNVRSVISHFNDSFLVVFPMIPLKALMTTWSKLRKDQA